MGADAARRPAKDDRSIGASRLRRWRKDIETICADATRRAAKHIQPFDADILLLCENIAMNPVTRPRPSPEATSQLFSNPWRPNTQARPRNVPPNATTV